MSSRTSRPPRRLSVSDPSKGEIDTTGKFTSRANGTLRLTAKFGGSVVETTITTDGAGKHRPFSFARDIGGILTRRGCNNSDCHGGVKGKGGYKLSINALHPEDDYRWTVEGGTFDVLSAEPKGPRIPRIDLKEPEKSLLLAKPTLQVAHGGGRRFELNSADAQAILKWVRAGAPVGEDSEEKGVSIQGVEVFPIGSDLARGGAASLAGYREAIEREARGHHGPGAVPVE